MSLDEDPRTTHREGSLVLFKEAKRPRGAERVKDEGSFVGREQRNEQMVKKDCVGGGVGGERPVKFKADLFEERVRRVLAGLFCVQMGEGYNEG